MASSEIHKAPKGTRDFYPPRMAIRRHIEGAWRSSGIDSGFDEIEGPMFEHLDLYTVKSGDEIISQLFSFKREGGDDLYALRPEFTPTLARMAVARGKSLSVPTKWFAIPSHFRAERPQRGRLREHVQWNVDVLGLSDFSADVDVISTALLALERLGLGPEDVKVRLSHRDSIARVLRALGVSDEGLQDVLMLLDRRDKMSEEDFRASASGLGLDENSVARFDQAARATLPLSGSLADLSRAMGVSEDSLEELDGIRTGLLDAGLDDWCVIDTGIVRGLAYYTGTVFEIFDVKGAERAIAGGGRYDKLVELFGGQPTPACGFGMGDVVLSLVLQEHGLLGSGEGEDLLPRPEVFLVSTTEEGDRRMSSLLVALRRSGIHARRSHKSTRNPGKLLAEAGKVGARHAVILGDELADEVVILKDLEAGTQVSVALDDLVGIIDQDDEEVLS